MRVNPAAAFSSSALIGSARRAALAALVLFAAAASVLGKITVPDPGTHVVDRANIIDAAREQQIEALLSELERKTTAQIKVLTVPSTDGEDVFGFFHRHAEAWKLGQRGKDNGALIGLALQEREVRIHTGYGLEAVLPDSWIGSTTRAIAGTYFKQGQYADGLYELARLAADRVADASGAKLSQAPAAQPQTGRPGPPPGTGVPGPRVPGSGGGCCCLITLVGVFLLLSVFGRSFSYNRRSGGWLPWMLFWMLMNSGSRRSGWGGGMGRGFGG
ncbi:MAG TPA: TPM domain-containing protein, partial [Phycisphaerae bacterium]|nr:TPM domain-containing protein [Phycisphaerae bacterium]